MGNLNAPRANWIGILIALFVIGAAAVLGWRWWVNSQRRVQWVDPDERRDLS